MPSIINKGSLAAKGFGFSSTTKILGGPYFINMVTFASGPKIQATSVAVDSSGNITLSGVNVNSITPYYNYFYQLNSTGVLQWQRYINNSYRYGTTLQYMTVDSTGNLLVTGYLSNSSGSDEESPTIQLANDGSINWQHVRYINSSSFLSSSQIAVDSSNNVYSNGTYNDSSGNFAWFLQSYSSGGSFQWGRIYPSTATTTQYTGYGVTYDSFSGNLYWNGFAYVSSHAYAVFLETDTSGNLLSQNSRTTYVTNEDLRGKQVVTDSSGNVYHLCAWSSATGNPGYFIFKYDSSGNFLFGRQFTNSSHGLNTASIALDSAGNVYTVSNYQGVLVIAKMNSSGNLVYQNQMTCTTNNNFLANGNAIIIDSNNNMYIYTYSNTSGYPILFKLPIDGSKTGTYSVVNPSPAGTYNFTYATSTLITFSSNDASGGGISNSFSSNSYSSITNNVTSTTQTFGTSTNLTI